MNPRRSLAYVGAWDTNYMHLRNPWVVAWWSAAFPGFGHLKLGYYLKGYLLIIWEIIINVNAGINKAMVHTFCGEFDLARQSLDLRWMALYMAVYLHAIWDSHRLTVENNKLYKLAVFEKTQPKAFLLTQYAINYLDRRSPWLAASWSILMPGLGYLYLHRLTTGIIIVIWWIIAIYYSHMLESLHFTLMGQFHDAVQVVNVDWLLFLPSMFCFSVYEGYVIATEYNKLYKREQAAYLQENYGYADVSRMFHKR